MATFDPTNLEGRDRLSHIETYLQSPFTDSLVRSQLVSQARGVLSEPLHIGGALNNSAMSASLAHSAAVGLRKGDVVTNILCAINTAQAPGIMQGGLHDKNGNHLGHTASLGASIVGSTIWAAPLTAPVTIATDDAYYVSVLSSGAATLPAINRAGAANQLTATTGSGIRPFAGTSYALSDLTVNLAFGNSPGGGCFWVACS